MNSIHQSQPKEMLSTILKIRYEDKPVMAIEEDIIGRGEWLFKSFNRENKEFFKQLYFPLDCFIFSRLFVLYDSAYKEFLALYYSDLQKRDDIVRTFNIPYVSGERFPNICWEHRISPTPGHYAFIPMDAINSALDSWQAEAYLKRSFNLPITEKISQRKTTFLCRELLTKF